jgi:hypothetical protein
MPQFDSGAAEPIGRFSEGLLLRLLQVIEALRNRFIPSIGPKRNFVDR